LGVKPDWVLYNEFVLTTKNYIRTVTKIEGDWLAEIAPSYYDVNHFPNGETKLELESLLKRRQKRLEKKRKIELESTRVDVSVHRKR
jgi:pre-mRNA-splicing factor ATP-dependent RNA helicase DHX15/PRP43